MGISAVACAPVATQVPGCVAADPVARLPDGLQESSGVAVSPTYPDILWTHNDGDSELYAIDREGEEVGRFPLRIVGSADMEDIASGRCPDGGPCLYVSDTGDNAERRDDDDVIRVLRVPEPNPEEVEVLEPEIFPMRLPEGARDIEAIFVLPGERPYFVTKGRADPVIVYRYPPPLRPDTVMLEEVQRMSAEPEILLDQVTGASASPSGSRIAIRTYRRVTFYDLVGERLVPVPGGVLDLAQLQEFQGEGVGLGPDGLVFLTSEGGLFGGTAILRAMRCEAAVG